MFHCKQWLDDTNGSQVELFPGDLVQYSVRPFFLRHVFQQYAKKVAVFTGDVRGAGTDSSISVEIWGEAGSSKMQHLAESIEGRLVSPSYYSSVTLNCPFRTSSSEPQSTLFS